jgi:hypothetical protein
VCAHKNEVEILFEKYSKKFMTRRSVCLCVIARGSEIGRGKCDDKSNNHKHRNVTRVVFNSSFHVALGLAPILIIIQSIIFL